ncbi:MAG: hypothetical protein IT242_10525 [Bacteroidia bacterium]|nr:hypothetical protein [Bacteroidia bacterium]
MKREPAFSFVLELLHTCEPVIRPLFGSHAVYIGEKIMLVLRNRPGSNESNGVWIATQFEHHDTLKTQLPSLCSVVILSEGKSETAWRMIPSESETFEEEVTILCELICKGDARIGRIPSGKKKKSLQHTDHSVSRRSKKPRNRSV